MDTKTDQFTYDLAPIQMTEGVCVDLYEFDTHPFVIKVWLEETVEADGQATWRGYIKHVPTCEQKYFHDLEDISTFVTPYLTELGVDFGTEPQLETWLKQVGTYLGRPFK